MTDFGDGVVETLENSAALFRQRNAVYGDNYEMVGRIMEAMFPDGKHVMSGEEFNRWHLFELAIVKLSRYAVNYDQGGHEDSLDDMIVYLAMVKELDRKARKMVEDIQDNSGYLLMEDLSYKPIRLVRTEEERDQS